MNNFKLNYTGNQINELLQKTDETDLSTYATKDYVDQEIGELDTESIYLVKLTKQNSKYMLDKTVEEIIEVYRTGEKSIYVYHEDSKQWRAPMVRYTTPWVDKCTRIYFETQIGGWFAYVEAILDPDGVTTVNANWGYSSYLDCYQVTGNPTMTFEPNSSFIDLIDFFDFKYHSSYGIVKLPVNIAYKETADGSTKHIHELDGKYITNLWYGEIDVGAYNISFDCIDFDYYEETLRAHYDFTYYEEDGDYPAELYYTREVIPVITEEYVSKNTMPASSVIKAFWTGTQAEYDALTNKSATTLYLIGE